MDDKPEQEPEQKIEQKPKQYTLIGIIIGVVVIIVAAVAFGFLILGKINKSDDAKNMSANNTGSQKSAKQTPPKEVTIKNLGVELKPYDPATNKAGDFVFTRAKFNAGEKMQMLFMNYGYVIPAINRADGKALGNPQPTFILPLGTKVRSMVDGTVFDTPKLYSGDYSVQVQGTTNGLLFETEHVINVKVKKGDKVKAGDVVAEVSDYELKGYAGFGLVEIGVLKGGNPPSHLCPFDYLDDSIKEITLSNITAFQKSWELYRGDSSIYDETKVIIPGCESRLPIEG